MKGATSEQASPGHGQGKLILFGEHAVVWGCPALVASLDRGAAASVAASFGGATRVDIFQADAPESPLFHATPSAQGTPFARAMHAILGRFEIEDPLDITLTLSIPPGAGLGSSAALAVALARALSARLAQDEATRARCVEEAVLASESIFHGSASGIDQAAAMGSGLIRFVRGADRGEVIKEALSPPPFEVLVCQPQEGASTARMVERVRARRAREGAVVGHMSAAIEAIVTNAIEAIEAKDAKRLGELCDLNHGLLAALGVSTRALDEACHIAREAGAYGAKLTGAGGGGCVWAIAPEDRKADVLAAWRRREWRCFATTINAASA